MAAFVGMRGTGDWATDVRPKNFRETILYLYPNGSAPLTALLSKMGSEKVDDPEFNWWTQTLPEQGGTVTGVYSDVALTTAIAASGTAAATTVYVKCAEAVADEFRIGHQALIRLTTDYTLDVNGKVINVFKNGASSYIAVKLLEADDNSTNGNDIGDANYIQIIGNINSEGAVMPSVVSYDPTKLYNYTQIFRTPLSITRTAQMTRLRTGDAYKEMKRQALELHSIEMEKAFLFGIATEGTGSNGKPERTTAGLIPVIKANASGNCNDFSLNTDFASQTWETGGEEWLDTQLEKIFRYGKREKIAFCGSGALLGINRLIKSKTNAQFAFNSMTKSYGIQVVEWVTAFGKINLITHPLFSFTSVNRNSMTIFEPENLKYRFVTDTTFYSDDLVKKSGYTRTDSLEEEFLTECGLEYHHPIGWGYLNGVGVDNELP